MWSTCSHAKRMSKMIQIRNVPDGVHRRLKARAALAGMTLSDYLLREVRVIAERPTADELVARIRKRSPARITEDSVDTVRRLREERS